MLVRFLINSLVIILCGCSKASLFVPLEGSVSIKIETQDDNERTPVIVNSKHSNNAG